MSSSAPADAEPDVFPPTLREVMLRPQWIGLLLLCLVVAGVFAWLGQWQLGRAIDTDPAPEGATEVVQPIDDVVEPGAHLDGRLGGQKVSVEGRFVSDDFLVVGSRYNDGVAGYWVTGQLRLGTAEGDRIPPTSLAVAIGWAATVEEAEAAVEALEGDPIGFVSLTGRLVADEGPVPPATNADPQSMTRMSPAALLGQWHDIDGLDVYRPYLVADDTAGGLVEISSPAPDEGSAVNWLNIFYAAEWAIFAGFAFYLWYRLAKDAWEREVEDLEDADVESA